MITFLEKWLPRLGTVVGVVFFFVIVYSLCSAMIRGQWSEATFWAVIWAVMKLDAIKEKL